MTDQPTPENAQPEAVIGLVTDGAYAVIVGGSSPTRPRHSPPTSS